MTPIFFSIITPHSNTSLEGDSLLGTLASAVDQEGSNIELLLQHGGGIAGLWGKLSRTLNLTSKKETVTLRVIEEKSASIPEALTAGVKRATGTWIGFLQPGEQYLPDTIKTLQKAIEAHPDVDVFLTSSINLVLHQPIVTPAIIPTFQYLTSVQPAWPTHSFFCRTSLLRDHIPLEPRYQHQMITQWLVRFLQGGLLAELADASEVQGVSGVQTRSVHEGRENTSTGATQQFTAAVELCKKSNGEKIKALPIITTFTAVKEKEQETLLPKTTGITSLLKPWWQWRHQAATKKAKSGIELPSNLLLYQNDLLTERTSLL
jgi:hypothetical protein